MSTCPYCNGTWKLLNPACGRQTPPMGSGGVRFACTRPAGHEGAHVACGVQGLHKLVRWSGDATEADMKEQWEQPTKRAKQRWEDLARSEN